MKNQEIKAITEQLLDHQPALLPNQIWDAALDDAIAALSVEGASPEEEPYALAVQSGLHLLNESLDRSHTLSQDIHNPTGSYWHGIMHRMEGDYGNAKYWFRLVGKHPVYEVLFEQACPYIEGELDGVKPEGAGRQLETLIRVGTWDPYRFVDLVEQQVNRGQDEAMERILRHVQALEMRALLQDGLVRCGGFLLE